MLELRPSTFNPPYVWLVISSSFVEVNGSREAFPEAGILDGHLNRGVLALKAPKYRGMFKIGWLKRGSGTTRLLFGADVTRNRRCKSRSRGCVRDRRCRRGREGQWSEVEDQQIGNNSQGKGPREWIDGYHDFILVQTSEARSS